MEIHDLSGDRKADTRPCLFSRIERHKDPFECLGDDPGAVVLDLEGGAQITLSHSPKEDYSVCLILDGLEGILYEIDQDHRDLIRITEYFQFYWVYLGLDVDVF